MSKKVLSLALAGLLMAIAGVSPVYASHKSDKETRFVKKVRDVISRLGTGEMAIVEVKLRNKTKHEGHIKEVGEAGFILVDAKTGEAATIVYSEVKQVRGHNLTTGQKIAIGVGITLGALLVLWLIMASSD